jgi:hypothetical protein
MIKIIIIIVPHTDRIKSKGKPKPIPLIFGAKFYFPLILKRYVSESTVGGSTDKYLPRY